MPTELSYQPSGTSAIGRRRRRYTLRLWSVRNARFLEWFYNIFAYLLLDLHPLWNLIGYERVEAPILVIERAAKGFLFDCRMCGQCVLSSTGMSCPMSMLNIPISASFSVCVNCTDCIKCIPCSFRSFFSDTLVITVFKLFISVVMAS